jgi:glucose-6-phosphate 1-epimerase
MLLPAGAFLTTYGQLQAVQLRTDAGASAIVTLYGAQLVSWQPTPGDERLFVSRRSSLDGAKAIRGGVPVIFPQFAEQGEGPRHGFARTATWRLTGSNIVGDAASISLELTQMDLALVAAFPHRFKLTLHVSIQENRLTLDLDVDNQDNAPFAFAAALHSYFRVDAARAWLTGLQGAEYTDQVDGGARRQEAEESVGFTAKLDRIYHVVEPRLWLREGERALMLEQDGFADAVVWNPGADDARALADMADEEYREFACVEAAHIAPVTLAPGTRWSGMQHWTAVGGK